MFRIILVSSLFLSAISFADRYNSKEDTCHIRRMLRNDSSDMITLQISRSFGDASWLDILDSDGNTLIDKMFSLLPEQEVETCLVIGDSGTFQMAYTMHAFKGDSPESPWVIKKPFVDVSISARGPAQTNVQQIRSHEDESLIFENKKFEDGTKKFVFSDYRSSSESTTVLPEL